MKDEIKEILDKLNNKAEHYILYNYEVKLLLNYITNLQDRTKELEQINEEHRKINGDLRTANSTLCEAENFMYNQAKDYKARIDIAIEYIKSNLDNTNWLELGAQDVEVLLNILQGKSDK